MLQFRLKTKMKEEILMNIYVGNLSYDATDDDVQQAFERFGQVESVSVICDQYDGRSKGFGFVEMLQNDEAQQAISELDGSELMGRTLKVNEARQREKRNQGRGSQRGGYNSG
jgi:RNA recognition motif-containing protein